MVRGLMIGTVMLGLAGGAVAGEIDLAARFPGGQARTHDLRAADGRLYRFVYFDEASTSPFGVWSRSIDDGWTDYHVQTEEGMAYLGWTDPAGSVHWSVPPEIVLPRWWDPATPWTRTFDHGIARRTAAGFTAEVETLVVTVAAVVVQGEPLIHMTGMVGLAGEHWWLSERIPVRGGGVAPGIRGYLLLDTAGAIVGSGEFVEWVPRGDR